MPIGTSAISSLLTAIITFSCLVLVVTTSLQKKQAFGEDILTVKPYLDTVLKNDQNFEVSIFSCKVDSFFQRILT